MYSNILIPTDGSELADKAVQHGIALARQIGARVTALTVRLPFHVLTVDPQMIEDTRARYEQRMQAHSETILAAVAKGCDLIVMASHGRRGMAAVLLGSETVKVLTHSRIPVLVHR
jgi:nucleotide-binding universal stress UspA family protein